MKINSAFFLVESPMQLINAIEAKHCMGVNESYLFVRYDGVASNDSQIDYILESIDKNFSHISKTILLYGKKSIIKMLMPCVLCLKFNPDYLFLGNYFSGYARLIRMLFPSKRTFFLDDGTQTTSLYYKNRGINLFSYFYFKDLFPGRLYIHHSFEFTKRKLAAQTCSYEENTIYFIGAPIIENNLMSRENYHRVVCSLLKCYKNTRIVYFPHRFENTTKFNQYEQIVVNRINMPIELYLLSAKTLARKIVSFYSAALYTIYSMLGERVDVEAFRIPSEYFIDKKYAQGVNALYDYLSQAIPIIDG